MARNKNIAFDKDRTFNIINPISQSTRDGVFKMSMNSIEKYKSNLYTLIFTSIGERVMEPNFGTTLKYLLFEPLTNNVYNNIKTNIIEQVNIWIPEIDIVSISFGDEEINRENNKISIKIDFKLKLDSTIQDFIEIEMGI